MLETTEYSGNSRNKYEIVSTVAYLIGVGKQYFVPDGRFLPDVYEKLDKDKNARIIRYLCILRTQIERNFKNFRIAIRDGQMLSEIPYYPYFEINELYKYGINLLSYGTDLSEQIIKINQYITERIGNIKDYFPSYLNWEYVKNMFIMPNGQTKEGCQAAAEEYYQNKRNYPYQCYINWKAKDQRNILYNDRQFVEMLYDQNGDEFTETSKVQMASPWVHNEISKFLSDSTKAVLVVDCENADPFRFCAAIKEMKAEQRAKISKIILCDDVNTSPAWEMLPRYIDAPLEYVLVERVLNRKSLVDMRLTAEICKEHYQSQVDSFVIVASDSDYYGVVSSLTDARFLLMIEREKSSVDLRQALSGNGIFYCFTEDFYQGNVEMLKKAAIMMELRRCVDEYVDFNAKEMLRQALSNIRLKMTAEEEDGFYRKVVKPMSLRIADDGTVSVEFGRP